MSAGVDLSLRIGQRVHNGEFCGKRVTGVVRSLSIDSEQGLMVTIALDEPIIIRATEHHGEARIYTQHAQAHEFHPFDARDELMDEMLAALRAAVAFIEGSPCAPEPFGLIRAVIAKAEGGQL